MSIVRHIDAAGSATRPGGKKGLQPVGVLLPAEYYQPPARSDPRCYCVLNGLRRERRLVNVRSDHENAVIPAVVQARHKVVLDIIKFVGELVPLALQYWRQRRRCQRRDIENVGELRPEARNGVAFLGGCATFEIVPERVWRVYEIAVIPYVCDPHVAERHRAVSSLGAGENRVRPYVKVVSRHSKRRFRLGVIQLAVVWVCFERGAAHAVELVGGKHGRAAALRQTKPLYRSRSGIGVDLPVFRNARRRHEKIQPLIRLGLQIHFPSIGRN